MVYLKKKKRERVENMLTRTVRVQIINFIVIGRNAALHDYLLLFLFMHSNKKGNKHMFLDYSVGLVMPFYIVLVFLILVSGFESLR